MKGDHLRELCLEAAKAKIAVDKAHGKGSVLLDSKKEIYNAKRQYFLEKCLELGFPAVYAMAEINRVYENEIKKGK